MMKEAYNSLMAKAMGALPVVRAMDNVKPGIEGRISPIDSSERGARYTISRAQS